MRGRINVEARLFTNQDFIKFMIKTGDQDKSIGLWIRAAMLAQEYWLEHRCIPEDHWSKEFEPLLESGLIRKIEGGYYLRGSKEQFAWLDQKAEAGRKSGEARRAKNRTGVNGRSTETNGDERNGTGRTSISISTSTSTSNSNSSSTSYATAKELADCWNGLGLERVNETPPALRSVNQAYQKKQNFGVDGNKQAFENYANVLKGPESWYTYAYTLEGFLLTPKTSAFYPGNFKPENYLDKPRKSKAQEKQENLQGIIFDESDFA